MYELDGDIKETLVDLLSIVILNELDNIVGHFYIYCYLFNTQDGSKFSQSDEDFLLFEFTALTDLTTLIWISILSILLVVHYGLNTIGSIANYFFGIENLFGFWISGYGLYDRIYLVLVLN